MNTMQSQTIETYVDDKKELFCTILDFLETPNDNILKFDGMKFKNLTEIVRNQKIDEDPKEMKQFLQFLIWYI